MFYILEMPSVSLVWSIYPIRQFRGVTMDEHRSTAMSEFRAHYFPNLVKEERKKKGVIVIRPHPGV